IGRWDDTYQLPGGFTMSGQQLVFWSAALMALVTIALVAQVRETPPVRTPVPALAQTNKPRLTAATLRAQVMAFGRDVFGDRQWRALYAVALAQMIFWSDFGSLMPL